MTYQHIAFHITVRNVDAADPRWGVETVLSFGGVRYVADEWDNDPRECAIWHMAHKVCGDTDIVAKFGIVRPLPRTFVLDGTHTPSDQRLA
jgi:hypothetical protein